MVSREQLMRNVVRASERLAAIDAQREAAMQRRDEAVRAAHAAGATYVELREATGMSPGTISKALKERR